MIHEQFQGQQAAMAQHGTMSTTFELRDAAIDRAKKRLEKYKRTAEKKEIDYDAYLDVKLRNDMRETHKYLAKVNESKMRKNKSKDGNKKDLPTGPGGLSQNQASEVQSKIREHIQSEIKKTPLSGGAGVGGVTGVGGGDKKRKKTQQTFDPLPLTQLPQLSSDPGSVFPGSLLPTADNFPFGPAGFSALSDRDIQNVLGDVKQENPGVGYETASVAATSAVAAATTAPVTTSATSPTTSDFYPAYQTNAALFQANPYLQQQYNAQYGQQMQWMQQQATQQANTTTTQANNYTSETQQAHLHDFLSNQYS
jgi:hypothetical protein